jgi:hypothetical protein
MRCTDPTNALLFAEEHLYMNGLFLSDVRVAPVQLLEYFEQNICLRRALNNWSAMASEKQLL